MRTSTPSATTRDLADVLPTLLAAFEDDPGIRWLYPDGATYGRAFPEAARLSAAADWGPPVVDVAASGAAVAVWVPPAGNADREAVEAAWAAHLQTHIEPSRFDDVFAWGEQVGRAHPTEPHWYLAMIGVAPDHQGRGHGGALLRSGLERCDRDGLPAYLESANPRNRTLYERHGFEALDEIRTGDSPPFWPMLRPAAEQP